MTTSDSGGRALRRRPWERVNAFWRYVIALIVIYVLLRYGVAYLSMWITGASNPQPVPDKLLTTYLALAVLSLGVQIAANDQWLHEFWDPLARLLAGPSDSEAASPQRRAVRLAVLAVPPLLVGWFVYGQLSPELASAATSRQQHPTMPDAWSELENPFAGLPEAEKQTVIDEGITLYQRNCRPCHGTPAHGLGPMAAGFRPRPIAFTDAGTIDTVVENYLVWRIEKGGLGLPPEATPWNSAMPPWEGELTREEIWKIIMAEYDIGGKQPRIPEAHQ